MLLLLGMQAALPQLQTLYLQNSDGSQPNPVCTRPDYKKEVLSSLKDLRNLDGERNPNSTGMRGPESRHKLQPWHATAGWQSLAMKWPVILFLGFDCAGFQLPTNA